MKTAFRQITHAARRQFFARVPGARRALFGEYLFAENTTRFSLQSIILVLMNLGALLCYLFGWWGRGASQGYVVLLCVNIALMALFSFLYAHMSARSYHRDNFLHRHANFLYLLVYAAAEVSLFVAGPQDIGSLVRLLAVPFAVGAIPIISQLKSSVILFALYLVIFLILPHTDYAADYGTYISFFGFWCIVFVCALLISFSVYSRVVNIFNTTQQYDGEHEELAALNARLDGEARQRTNLLRLVNDISTSLLNSDTDNFDLVLFDCMREVGLAVAVDRVYMWKNHIENDELYCTQTHEWSGGAEPQQGNELTVSVPFPEAWYPQLSTNQCVNNNVSDFEGYEREHLEAQDIVSILVVPVFIYDEFWGFVGFDDCQHERHFTDVEETILRTISLLFSTSFIRNELTARLLSATDEALASSRAKTDFLSNMSHEIRTPINAITGMSSLARMAESKEEVNRCLDRIDTASRQLLSLINDILDMSKIEAGKIELAEVPFHLTELLRNIQSIVGVQAHEKGLQLVTEFSSDLPDVVIGDDMRLSQIVINLLSNAIKFTPKGGRVVFRAWRTEHLGDGRDMISLSVQDTGIGISPEQLDTLFHKFEQADRSISRQYGGTGLGLSISESFVLLMDGTISVTSTLGEGSCFTVCIPLTVGTADMLDTRLEPGGEGGHDFSSYRALLVEDIDINREIAISMLEPTGLHIDEAANGREAVDMVTSEPARYDIILMDLHMPEMDGYTAAREIRALGLPHTSSVPIIAMTANAFAEDIQKCLDAGMNDHVAKPIDFDELLGKLRRYLQAAP